MPQEKILIFLENINFKSWIKLSVLKWDSDTSNIPLKQNPEVAAFFDLHDEENESLYEGCDIVSFLQEKAILLHIKSNRNISGLGFDNMCGKFKQWLSADNILPPSFDTSMKLMKSLD